MNERPHSHCVCAADGAESSAGQQCQDSGAAGDGEDTAAWQRWRAAGQDSQPGGTGQSAAGAAGLHLFSSMRQLTGC